MPTGITGKYGLDVETKNFNMHVNQFLRSTSIDIDKGLKKFAFDLLKKIILKNPVDTGRSRAAWYVSAVKLGGAGVSFSLTQRRAKSHNIDAANEGLRQGKYRDHLGPFITDKWIEMINGVDYIIFLEYGHSRQAPYGMVRVSIREMTGGKLPRDLGRRIQKQWNRFYYQGQGGGGFYFGGNR